jgi:hypothetical protein
MGRRWIHRRGALFEASLGRDGSQPLDALVRLSSTFGWPRPLPEWIGMAIRITREEGEHLDLLLVSSAPPPELWRQMRPSREVLGCSFSSVARYPIGGPGIVAAVPVESRSAGPDGLVNGHSPCPVGYQLRRAEQPGQWQPLGELVLTRRLEDDRAIRFSPPHDGPGLLTLTRRAVYALAQRP